MNRNQPVPPKTDDDPWIRFFGEAVIRLKNKQKIPARFTMKSADGMLPGHVELTAADPDAADLAWHNGPRIELEICGAKVCSQIISQNKHNHVLLLLAASFLRSLARAIAAYDK
jgi:hypothetical protein